VEEDAAGALAVAGSFLVVVLPESEEPALSEPDPDEPLEPLDDEVVEGAELLDERLSVR
jgi:hypothetical protein